MIGLARDDDEGGPPGPAGSLCVRARKEYRDYLHRLALMERCSISTLIDRSIARYARDVAGISEPPKR